MKLFPRPILAIETSCDETSVAVVHELKLLANVVSSQAELHKKWGGVVPEAAARAHVEAILPAMHSALDEAGMGLRQMGAIAVTNRPGLVGALSVGVTAAKALSFALEVPLIGIHHLEGHLCSVFALGPPTYPHVALIVSGGHTELVFVEAPGRYEIVGQTLDDAAGEAFDKGARLLGLGYPGGKEIQEAARHGNPNRYSLPRGLGGQTYDFSFSGLKTAMQRLVEKEGAAISVPDAAASLQEAIVSVLAERAVRAAETLGARSLALVGGVAANEALRARTQQLCQYPDIRLLAPPYELCTDNAAMIGLAAAWRLGQGESDDLELDVWPNSDLPAETRQG